MNRVCSPDLIIVGGGASKKWLELEPFLDSAVPLAVAESKNEAGIIGAALASKSLL